MASVNPNVVVLQTNGYTRPPFERAGAVAVTPGDLLELTSTGQVTPVATLSKQTGRLFAVENPFAPDPKQTALAQAYAVGDQVRYVYGQSGDLINARLAASQTVAIGDYLTSSATAGCLAKPSAVDATLIDGSIIGVAEQAVTTTGSVGRIQVRLL